jgi:arylsulfatase A-like enzyme
VALIVAASAGCRGPDDVDERLIASCSGCNVVLISIDTLRADHLQPYGYSRATAPALARLAEDSVLFERCVAQAPTTLPSHMSIFTSLYPSHHGVFRSERWLSDDTVTFVDLLHGAGYTTAAFTGGGFVREKFNYHTFDTFVNSAFYDLHNSSDDRQLDQMLEWIAEREQATSPFFLFWHTYRVHSPYSPPPGWDRFSDSSYDGPVEVAPDQTSPVCDDDPDDQGCRWKGKSYYDRLLPELGAADVQQIIDKYDGEILEVDSMIDRLWQQLEATGLLDDTVVILTSDHGESFADREKNRRVGHALLYNEVLEVPLLFWVPGQERGARVGGLVESIDIGPTLLEILGFEAPAGIDGRSLLTPGTSSAEVAYSESPSQEMRTVIWKGLKLIESPGEYELYDLRTDPGELQNLWGTGHPAEQKLVDVLATIVTGEVVLEGERELDEETLQELKALGYL